MQNLEFYKTTKDNVVFVYHKPTEFFALYSPNKKTWCQPDNITFMQLTHDHDYSKITQQEAFGIADEKSLLSLFDDYQSILKSNYGD